VIARVVPRCNAICTDLPRRQQKLVELQMVIAERAWNRSAPRKIFADEGTYHVSLETFLLIDDVVGDADLFGDSSGVIHIVDGAAAALHSLRHAVVSCESPLVPQLQRKPDDGVPFCAQHRRDGRRIDPARHGDRNRAV
jgi:hypothetical protein